MTEQTNQPTIPDKALLTPQEVAHYLSISPSYVYQLLGRGEIPSIKLDRLRRVRKVDLDAYIESKLAAK